MGTSQNFIYFLMSWSSVSWYQDPSPKPEKIRLVFEVSDRLVLLFLHNFFHLLQLNYISILFHHNHQLFLHQSVVLACFRKRKASERRFWRVKAQEVLHFGVAFLIGKNNSLFLRVFLFSLSQYHRKVICDVMKVEMYCVCVGSVPEVKLQKETSHLSGILKTFQRISVDLPLSLQFLCSILLNFEINILLIAWNLDYVLDFQVLIKTAFVKVKTLKMLIFLLILSKSLSEVDVSTAFKKHAWCWGNKIVVHA